MSYDLIEHPPQSRLVWRSAVAAAVVMLALAATAGWVASRPSVVSVDGAIRQIEAGTTIGDLTAGSFKASAGDLIAIDGAVTRVHGGQPPRILRNGRPATRGELLHHGDVLISRAGSDVRESIETTEVVIPYSVTYVGEGSLLEERVPGVEGKRVVTRGTASGIEVSSTILSEPENSVVQRMHPRPGSKIVALTFDDGPWPTYTAQVLDVLKHEQAVGTFFMLGVRVNKAPDLARRVVAEGHQVGSHSLGHRYLSKGGAKEVRRQIRGGREAIKRATGVDTAWLRPPYGAMDAKAWKIARAEKAKVVKWDVDPRDWKKGRSPNTIAKSAVKNAKPGSIILLHDGGGDRKRSVKALELIIKRLRARGYSFVTVEELYAVRRASK